MDKNFFILVIDANPRYLDGGRNGSEEMRLLADRIWSLLYIAEECGIPYINIDLENLDRLNLHDLWGKKIYLCGIYGDGDYGCVSIAARILTDRGWNVAILEDATYWEHIPPSTDVQTEFATDIIPDLLKDFPEYWEYPDPPFSYRVNGEDEEDE